MVESETGYIIDGETYTSSEVAQAEKLIFRGKQFAAQGDPRMIGLIKSLQKGGQRSQVEMKAQERVKEEYKVSLAKYNKEFSEYKQSRLEYDKKYGDIPELNRSFASDVIRQDLFNSLNFVSQPK